MENNNVLIDFTDSAVEKVAELIKEESNPDVRLRIFVQGGGCSGFQYGFAFDDIVSEDDIIITRNGVSLIVDAMSIQYLSGAQFDYQVDLMGSRFAINNPNAQSSCGCGSSFSM